MATYAPPKKNTEYIMYVALDDWDNPGVFKSNPTLASGDAKVSKDGGALANLSTLPSVTPASSVMVKVTLSASEMNADNVTVVFSDQTATTEWGDLILNLQTATNQFDDLATPSEVNAEVLDVLTTDTFAEAGSVPAATSSLKDKINWLFALARNKITQTSSTQTLRNDADDGSVGTSTVSDDGTTFTRGEWS